MAARKRWGGPIRRVTPASFLPLEGEEVGQSGLPAHSLRKGEPVARPYFFAPLASGLEIRSRDLLLGKGMALGAVPSRTGMRAKIAQLSSAIIDGSARLFEPTNDGMSRPGFDTSKYSLPDYFNI